MRSEIYTIRGLAQQIRAAHAQTPDQVSLYGLMAGALYALSRAAELDFDDYRAIPDVDVFNIEFQSTAANVANGSPPPTTWLAGFYFHSAIMRLDAVDTRLAAALGHPDPKGGPIREAVNALKHDGAAHISGTNIVDLRDAIAKTQRLCSLLQTWMTQSARSSH